MSDGWAWAAERARARSPAAARRLRIETVADDPGYWAAWDAAFGREGFPPEMYFARGAAWEQQAERLTEARGGQPLVDRWLIREAERRAGSSPSTAASSSTGTPTRPRTPRCILPSAAAASTAP